MALQLPQLSGALSIELQRNSNSLTTGHTLKLDGSAGYQLVKPTQKASMSQRFDVLMRKCVMSRIGPDHCTLSSLIVVRSRASTISPHLFCNSGPCTPRGPRWLAARAGAGSQLSQHILPHIVLRVCSSSFQSQRCSPHVFQAFLHLSLG